MMNDNRNPWTQFEAFEPMLTDYVSFVGNRGSTQLQTTIQVCLFPIENADPLLDIDVESAVKMVSIVAKEDSFMSYDKNLKPQVGDMFITENDEKYKVTSVQRNNGFYDIIGRSV